MLTVETVYVFAGVCVCVFTNFRQKVGELLFDNAITSFQA